MRQLDTCDFCADAADGVYEVVPASVAGESRRLALCADCRATLQSVVDPLLDAADREATPNSDPEPEPESKSGAESGRSDDTNSDDSDASASASDAETGEDGIVIESGSDSAEETADADEGTTDESGGESGRERRPSGYGQVVRLLQNRDGAMPREDLRALATNAYDLGGREFEDAVEAAVENGDVEESPAGLRTA